MGRTTFSPEHRSLIALLRRLREDAGLRQVDVAAALERPQSYVSKYETGERRLDLIELRAICIVLGISLPQLTERFESEVNARQSDRER